MGLWADHDWQDFEPAHRPIASMIRALHLAELHQDERYRTIRPARRTMTTPNQVRTMRRFAKLALALAVLLVGTEARAAYTITFAQSGNDVVATGSGSLNITGLTLEGVGTIVTFVAPTSGSVVIGTDQAVADLYVAFLSGPASFGPGLGAIPTSGSAGPVGYFTQSNFLEVPTGYASGSAISATSTFANRSIAGLGLAPGTYVYSYSATAGGTILDTITVRINAVPEPASMAMVGLGLAGVGLAVRFRR